MKTRKERQEREKKHLEYVRNNIRTKTFLRLPLGNYELNDGIYTYSMTKGLNIDGSPYYRIIEKGGSFYNNVFILERDEDVYENDAYEAGRYFRKGLKAISGVGGLNVHGAFDFHRLKSIIKV